MGDTRTAGDTAAWAKEHNSKQQDATSTGKHVSISIAPTETSIYDQHKQRRWLILAIVSIAAVLLPLTGEQAVLHFSNHKFHRCSHLCFTSV
jgi:hypothetical protein